jgi:hypothetical protein
VRGAHVVTVVAQQLGQRVGRIDVVVTTRIRRFGSAASPPDRIAASRDPGDRADRSVR